MVQFANNLLNPQPAIGAFLEAHGVGGVVRGAFASGKLSGRYFHAPPQLSPDDIRSKWLHAPTLAAEFARCAVFEELLNERRGMVQLALRWLLDEPATSTIIPGGKSVENYAQAIRATEIAPLTKTERERIAQLSAELNRKA